MAATGIIPVVLVAALGVGIMLSIVLRAGRSLLTLARATAFFAILTLIGTGIGLVAGGAQTLSNKQLEVTVPVVGPGPRLPDGVVDATTAAHIVGGSISQATLSVEGLSLATRLLLFGNQLIWAITIGAIAIIALRAAHALRDGDIFSFGPRAIMITAVIVAVGGVIGSVLGDIGDWRAGVEALDVSGFGVTGPLVDAFDLEIYDTGQQFLANHGWLAPQTLEITIPFWPISVGLALAIIGAAFRAGQRLRGDVEELQDDVRGLV
ncbi:hypothetical protein [Tessaracoccus caeni]|uniref:hypothetical protein n=1 Tax=Tessaracoccus caeni TaxID=3031239 RepID=UPI0023D9E7C4|nr:hypothetical protein [Tessaracoccus caeni]MDF1490354.1 hypothetical protein [Tessaracoccus caeni]